MPKVEESMRELIFRGKSIETGEWVEGFYLFCEFDANDDGGYYPETPIYVKEHFIVDCFDGDGVASQDIIKVIPETVGQYTGLKDKNGKKVFECDVLRFTDRRVWYSTALFTLSYEEETKNLEDLKQFPYEDRVVEMPNVYEWWSESDRQYWEVIGNIHDNKEDL